MPVPTEEERLGTLIDGKYRLERILGRGGMGVVFAGVHTGTGRAVAVKLLRPEWANNSTLAKRFLTEARAAGQLSHPHIIEVLDVGRDADGTLFMVLERLEGAAFGDVLERFGALAPQTVLALLRPVLDAVAEAHKRRVLHRDLKPENVYLDVRSNRLEPKLLDFGIALVEGLDESRATRAGSVLGSVEYMAPEQAQGRSDLDARVDVWSLGVMLFEALSGSLPFEGATPAAMLAQIVTVPAKPLREAAPHLPPALCEAVDGALVSDRAARYASVDALRAALELAASTLPPKPPTELDELTRWVRAEAARARSASDPPPSEWTDARDTGDPLASLPPPGAPQPPAAPAATVAPPPAKAPRPRTAPRVALAATLVCLALGAGALLATRVLRAAPPSALVVPSVAPSALVVSSVTPSALVVPSVAPSALVLPSVGASALASAARDDDDDDPTPAPSRPAPARVAPRPAQAAAPTARATAALEPPLRPGRPPRATPRVVTEW